ncbi:MAG: aminotransferase class III-fold pyridoxal phosphate-dependent enzyme [Actinobacteria bacterium]|nr:aminotransferase class III-fold pyridoxal phosphate-dependent enzyme [Actinomycetota bacterium]
MSSLWHGFAEMHVVQDHPFVVTRGEGAYIWDQSGKRYLDGTAALWFAHLGFGRPEVAAAVARQMNEISAYHNFTDYVTQPTIDLADTLTGNPERTVFIAREWAYHGMHTYGTSLAGIEANRTGYGELVPDVVLVPHDDVDAIEKAIDHAGPERIAGIYCEPVLGAGGVRSVPVEYLHSARDLVREAGGLFISDEVITGFGRIGDWFAAVRFDLDPDLILFAKGVTAGYLPLGGIIVSPRVASPFFDQAAVVWRHGYTYTGHATVCAAGLAVTEIYENEPIFARALELEKELEETLGALVGEGPAVGLRAGTGAMAALQLDPADTTLAPRVALATRQEGVIVRALAGNGIQISPPLILTPGEVDELASGLQRGLRAI